MFKNIARTLQHIALSRLAVQPAQLQAPNAVQLSAKELAFTGRGKGGKHSSKPGNAAALKRASKKASNIRKYN
jgi:hypothetical protein